MLFHKFFFIPLILLHSTRFLATHISFLKINILHYFPIFFRCEINMPMDSHPLITKNTRFYCNSIILYIKTTFNKHSYYSDILGNSFFHNIIFRSTAVPADKNLFGFPYRFYITKIFLMNKLFFCRFIFYDVGVKSHIFCD